jgi:mannose-1-phosphate guanylyltransferase
MTRTEKPWGWYETLEECSNLLYKVKTIYVNPDQQFSLQRHIYRQEFWVVVEGEGTVITSTYTKNVTKGDYIHIRKNEIHRMRGGPNGIRFVEVQEGVICEEEDIVRLEDDYGRI